jgi:predicted ATPase
MRRYILTGAPGAGKTAILRQLEMHGFGVVEEAATDLIALRQAQGIAEPWTDPEFIDEIAALQWQRHLRSCSGSGEVQFHDRSMVCTRALAEYLGFPVSETLTRQLDRMIREGIYETRVFFVRNLGFITPTSARRISYGDSLRFERIHEETYRARGFEIVDVAPDSVAERTAAILAHLPAHPRARRVV